mmetsp:Transcript_29161/g.82231  ORF Transcript_29161/g.82231 Transcript_29161/m.82231 type:complete len:267 (-) Transcript_29161:8-808(-)
MSGNRTDRLCLPPLHLGVRRFPNSLAIRTDLKSSEYADTWKAGYALGQFLEGDVCAERLAGRAVLELGAGCGYAGLVAATLGAQVVLSDQEPLLRVLSRNVQDNHSVLPIEPTVALLDWRYASHRNALAARHDHFDYILSSDCMYEEDCIEPLIAVLRSLSSPRDALLTSSKTLNNSGQQTHSVPATEVLFALENRGPGSQEIHQIFFSKISKWFKPQELTDTCSHRGQMARSDLRLFRFVKRSAAPQGAPNKSPTQSRCKASGVP